MAEGKKPSCGADLLGCIFRGVRTVYEKVYERPTKIEVVQKLHMFYFLFWATFLLLPLLYWEGFMAVLMVALITSPLWFIPMLVGALWHLWMDYIHLKFLADPKQEPMLLEIIVPKDIQKSPKAMELFFEGLLIEQGKGTFISDWWTGGIWPWWSVEIVGKEGEVRMYLWTWRRYRDHVEAQLYAQFPDVELREVPDYVVPVQESLNMDTDVFWAMQYLLKEDEFLPIKTYTDYKLDEHADKWETKVDPMVNILEKFTLPGPGEQLWLQILFTKSGRKTAEEADKAIQEIYSGSAPQVEPSDGDPEQKVMKAPMMTVGDFNKIKAIEQTSKKPSFDCVVRGAYVAQNGTFNSLRIQSLLNMFKNYDGYNRFGIDGGAYLVGYDYPWSERTLAPKAGKVKGALNAFRLRSALHVPYKRPSITLTTEELATIFHFPSQESQTPGLEKKQARSAEPPLNLPTE